MGVTDPTDDVPLYPGATPPGLRVPCVVGWAGRTFRALRLMHPRRRAAVWATVRDGEVHWLPPVREARRWGPHPDWWRPEQRDSYPGQLPPPLDFRTRPARPTRRPTAEPAAIGEHAGFSGVPPTCFAGGTGEHAGFYGVPPTSFAGGTGEEATSNSPRRRPTWWLDASQISYSPPGAIGRVECEGRLLRAVAAAGVVSRSHRPPRSAADLMTALGDALADGGAPSDPDDLEAVVERFEPTPRDVADWLIPMSWFAALDRPALRHSRREPWSLTYRQRLIVWRASTRPYSFAKIGEWHGRSAELVRQAYGAAIDEAHRIANGTGDRRTRRPASPVPLAKDVCGTPEKPAWRKEVPDA